MSTASEGIPTDQPPRTDHQPGALALLTATAVGGLIATRLSKTPFVLAAGATALALLNQTRPKTTLRQPKSLQPAAKDQPLSQVEQWLTRQIDREEQAPAVDLPLQDSTSTEIEEDYTPPPFLMEEAQTSADAPFSHQSFAYLFDPVSRVTTPPPMVEPGLPALQALESTESSPTSDAAWILGVEPLPSLHESATPPVSASSMFTASPGPMEAPVPPPDFSAPVFEGRALPDEIEVNPSMEPVLHLTPVLSPEPASTSELNSLPENSPATEVVEIPVQLAPPGEASFDPPLGVSPQDPWQPLVEPAIPATTPAPPSGPVIEAEIILRPRAPTQTAVIAKSKPISPRFAATIKAPGLSAPEPTPDENAPLPQAPLQSPREQRARKTWRSWWRGD